jgi:preprotein translocase subunit SecG
MCIAWRTLHRIDMVLSIIFVYTYIIISYVNRTAEQTNQNADNINIKFI